MPHGMMNWGAIVVFDTPAGGVTTSDMTVVSVLELQDSYSKLGRHFSQMNRGSAKLAGSLMKKSEIALQLGIL